MVTPITIGVLGIQGAISEHVQMMQHSAKQHQYNCSVVVVRNHADLARIDGLIIPGGESTTISKFLLKNDLHQQIQQRVQNQTLSVMGTCAGCILVASEIEGPSFDLSLLSLMDMKVKRNAFGRQKESFEKTIQIDEFTNPFTAVFIRAPLILNTWGECKPLATIEEGIVMACQHNVLALTFHPELTNNTCIHDLFYTMVRTYKKR